jgi:tripartite ATP-independent transporter DctM subunit
VVFGITIYLKSRLSSTGATEIRVRATWSERIASLPDLVPPLLICLVIIGSIYTGLATPTESAGLGVVAALGLAAARGGLGWRMLATCFEGTMRTTGMIMLIIIFAYMLNFVLSGVGLTGTVNAFISDLGLSPLALILVVVLFYLILGCFMETLSMMITTIPILAPIVFAAGYDSIWFGVVVMILVELAMITPPIGVNLYVVQSIRPSGNIEDVIIGVVPFIIAMLAMIGLLIAWPGMTTLFLDR